VYKNSSYNKRNTSQVVMAAKWGYYDATHASIEEQPAFILAGTCVHLITSSYTI